MDDRDIYNSVVAKLSFLQWQDLYKREKPYEIYVDLPDGYPEVKQNNLLFQQVDTVINDVRGHEDRFQLENQGFQFEKFPTKLQDADLGDRHLVESIYLPEVEDLLRTQYPNANRIFIFDWRVSEKGLPWALSEVDFFEKIRKYQPPNHAPLNLNNRTAYVRPATEVHVGKC
jgi:hypothetical protein